MPEIHIRPVIADDISKLMALDHSYSSDHVWQMDIEKGSEESRINVHFRQIRLPRSVRVDYPRHFKTLATDWTNRSGLLVTLLNERVIGYVSLMLDKAPLAAWITDLVVDRDVRRQGIGSALVIAALEWGTNHACRYLVLEMQPKNFPTIQLAGKLGFDFCGYNDRYYPNNDISLFFAKSLR
jgi:ribosomal protein S18 acetylase RimI-like enzyme